VGLTEVGQAYYQRCVQILAELDDADQIAHAMQSNPRGSLRLNVAIPIPSLIAPVIAEFVQLYPEVSIDMTMTTHGRSRGGRFRPCHPQHTHRGLSLVVRKLPLTPRDPRHP
jgi:DNA-binding transcriptional LysR family regulator